MNEIMFLSSLQRADALLPIIQSNAFKISQSNQIESSRASLRRMKAQLAYPAVQIKTPTQRFIEAHSISRINAVLRKYRATERDLALFKEIISNEDKEFLGYQAGSSTVRLFQDMIAILIKEVLRIPIKDDFFFTRLPGDGTFHFETADDFLEEMGKNIPESSWDNQPHIREHILSMNMNLYQSYDAPWDLTPRYYLENTTWTHANVRDIIKPLFSSLGIDAKTVDRIWSEALDLLPHDRGYILQFFDRSKDFSFTRQHAYIAHSGGKPHSSYRKHEILFDQTATNFPQIRLVMSNESTLNPFSDLEIKRYDGMTESERSDYENSLRDLLKNLCFDQRKVELVREELLSLWSQKPASV